MANHSSHSKLRTMFTLFASLAAASVFSFESPVQSAAAAVPEVAMARPQPEMPVCSRCSLVSPQSSGDKFELGLVVDPVFEGEIVNVVLYTTDSSNVTTTHTFGVAVIADLNSVDSNITILEIDEDDIVMATLIWSVGDPVETSTETVTML